MMQLQTSLQLAGCLHQVFGGGLSLPAVWLECGCPGVAQCSFRVALLGTGSSTPSCLHLDSCAIFVK